MSDGPAPGTIGALATAYAEFCAQVARRITEQEPAVEDLVDAIGAAGAVHCYGFGRSGNAATALAIRLRHFQRALPPAWWVGDQVRNPFRSGDLLIAFSRRGNREDLIDHVEHAHARGLRCAFVTVGSPARGTPETLVWPNDIVIGIPAMDREFLAPARIYGGGDFELGAYLFQELLISRIGFRHRIPVSDIPGFHVW